ncbi:MAG: hypothetical protein ACK5FE_02125 [Cyanobacteriota bacterium]|jgi:hypothetical protein
MLSPLSTSALLCIPQAGLPQAGLLKRCFGLGMGLAIALPLLGLPARAQVESFLLKPGSKVGRETRIEATNCQTAADGTITCDTKVMNEPGYLPAKPQYQPFKN